jgi:uncharacterized protein
MFLTNDDAHLSLEALEQWLSKYEGPLAAKKRGRAADRALVLAMRKAPDEVMERLIELSTKPQAQRHGCHPLGEAARFGRLPALQALLAKGCDPNLESEKPPIHQDGEEGYRPLLLAIEGGHAACVEALLAAGADPTLPSHTGNTPVAFARAKGHEAIAALLEAGGGGGLDVTSLDLEQAAHHGAVERVMKLAASSTEQQRWNAVTKAVDEGHGDVFRALMAHLPPRHVSGALSMACHRGRVEMVRAALEAGAPVNGWEDDGAPILRVVANGAADREAQYLAALQELIDHGVDVDSRNSLGMTALMSVCQSAWSIEAARLLIEHGADLDAVDSKKFTVLKWAKRDYARTDKTAMAKFIRAARRDAKKRAQESDG